MFCVRMVNTIRSNNVTFIWSNPIHITPIPGPDYRLPFGMYKRLLRSMVQDEGAVVKKKTIVCSVDMSLRERLCSVELGENRFMERSFFLLLRPLALPPC